MTLDTEIVLIASTVPFLPLLLRPAYANSARKRLDKMASRLLADAKKRGETNNPGVVLIHNLMIEFAIFAPLIAAGFGSNRPLGDSPAKKGYVSESNFLEMNPWALQYMADLFYEATMLMWFGSPLKPRILGMVLLSMPLRVISRNPRYVLSPNTASILSGMSGVVTSMGNSTLVHS